MKKFTLLLTAAALSAGVAFAQEEQAAAAAAAATDAAASAAQQTQQIKGTFWHSGNLWIVAEHLNTGNQRPDTWEQKGKRSAIGNVFFKVADTEMQKNNSAQSRHYNLKGSNNQGREHNSGKSGREQIHQMNHTACNHQSSH